MVRDTSSQQAESFVSPGERGRNSTLEKDSLQADSKFTGVAQPEDQPETSLLLAQVEGPECQWCDDGSLAIGPYKGDRAAVCDECGTPGIRVW